MKCSNLAPGFLLAAPRLGDPNFERTVVLLGRHDQDGALGWVLNGRGIGSMHEVLKGSKFWHPEMSLSDNVSFARTVRVGGPVSPATGWLIYQRVPGQTMDGEIAIGESLGVTTDAGVLANVLRGDPPHDFRMVLGYSGWAPGQLENEIRAGAWLPVDADAALVFSSSQDTIWSDAYERSVGISPGAFTSTRGGSA